MILSPQSSRRQEPAAAGWGPSGRRDQASDRILSNSSRRSLGSLTCSWLRVADWKRRDLAKVVAFVRQGHDVTFEFNVRELVLMGKTPHKGWLEPTTRKDLDDVESALAQLNLEDFGGRSTLALSGGELQRVFLAQALVQDADLLLLDEPTTHLDVYHQYELLEHVKEIVAHGRSAVAVFHDLGQAARYCDRLVVLDGGRQRAFAPPKDVLDSDLIKNVFRMHATITQSDGIAGITYLRPAE